jgi:hypothetical protein
MSGRGGRPVSHERFSFNQATARCWPHGDVVAGCGLARAVRLLRSLVPPDASRSCFLATVGVVR